MMKIEENVKASSTAKGKAVIYHSCRFIINNIIFEQSKTKEEMVIRILKNESRKRTLFDLRKLDVQLGKIKFFQDLKENDQPHVVSQCLHDLTLHEKEMGSHLMKIGEIGDAFYVVIQGSFDVFVPFKSPVRMSDLEYFKMRVEKREFLMSVNDKNDFDKM